MPHAESAVFAEFESHAENAEPVSVHNSDPAR